MVFARVSSWKFKPGQREEGGRTLEEYVESIPRAQKGFWGGFRGALTLLSMDDPDTAITITLWESEDYLKVSSTEIFQDAVGKIKQLLVAAPEVKNYKLDSTELHI